MASDFRTGRQWVVSMDDVRRLAPRYGWDVTDQDLPQLDGASFIPDQIARIEPLFDRDLFTT